MAKLLVKSQARFCANHAMRDMANTIAFGLNNAETRVLAAWVDTDNGFQSCARPSLLQAIKLQNMVIVQAN